MAFKMKGSEFYGKGAFKKIGDTGETDPKAETSSAGEKTSTDDALTRAVLRASTVRFPEGLSEEGQEAWMHSPEGKAAREAAHVKAEEAREKGEEYWQGIEKDAEAASERSAEKRAAQDAEKQKMLEATKAKNDAGYNRMSKRQQKKFREENPQYFS